MRIKLVVVNEHTLGYIDPDRPHTLSILRLRTERSAPFSTMDTPRPLFSSDYVRLASRLDFKAYRVCFDGFDDETKYEYQTINTPEPCHTTGQKNK